VLRHHTSLSTDNVLVLLPSSVFSYSSHRLWMVSFTWLSASSTVWKHTSQVHI